MAIQMSDKFKKNLPPGKGTGNGKPKPAGFTKPGFMSPPQKGGTIKLDPRESDGTFNKLQPANPAKAAGRHPGFQKPTGTVGTFKPNPAKAAGQHPGFQKPTGKVGNFPANPAKTGGTIKIDRREMDGTFNNSGPKQTASKAAPMKRSTGMTRKPTPMNRTGGEFTKSAPPKDASGQPLKGSGIPRKGSGIKRQGAHQEFVKRAKEQGISENEITKFIAKKIRPKTGK